MRKTYKNHKSKKYKSNKNSRVLHKTTRRNRYRKLVGGSLIGQGNFGCVFRPSLPPKMPKNMTKILFQKQFLRTTHLVNTDMSIKFLKK